jgi:hypothetical protein
MTRRIAIALLLVATVAIAAENDDETRARKAAFDVAGAFSNDGFKTRDGYWAGRVAPRERTLVAVNLYAGNQYWFSAGAADDGKKIAVELFDEGGRQVTADNYNSGGAAAAGVSPTNSGQYFVSLTVADQPTTCCLIYSYK